MKYDLTFAERHLLADLLRVKAARQLELAGQRSAAASQQEMRFDAATCVELAIKFEDGYEPTASERAPATVNATRDLDQLLPPEVQS